MASQQTIARGLASGAIKIPPPPKALKAVTPKRQTRPTPIPKPGASQQQIAIATNGTGTPGVVNIIPTASRGAYTTKGTPGGAPAKPQPGQLYTQPNGTQWVYRPAGPNGPGWYTRGSSTQSEAQKAGIMANSATPPATTPPATTTTPTGPTPGTPEWWRAMYTGDPRYLRTDAALRGEQNQVGQTYGLYINRDASGSALYGVQKKDAAGKPMFDENGDPVWESSGITQGFDANGKMVYRDAAGKEYDPTLLVMDVRRVRQGEDGYLNTQLGSTTQQSANQQFNIANTAAQAGAGKSGMRAQGSLAETAALQAALANIGTRAAGEYAGIDSRYADLFTTIYDDLVKQAGDVAPPETPAEGGDTGGSGGDTGGAGGSGGSGGSGGGAWWDSLSSNTAGDKLMPSGSRGGYTQKGTPSGSNKPKKPVAGTVFKGSGGVVWVYRTAGPNGAGWYRKPAAAASGGNSGGSSGAGNNTSGGGASTPPPAQTPWWNTMGANTVGSQLMPSGSRGGFTVKGAPSGSNKPSSPSAGTVFKGASGVVWVYRTEGPNGAGWYKKP